MPTHRLKVAKWVSVIAEIRENSTGEVREYRTKDILRDFESEPSEFTWSDGNYACDCNRALFFARANNEPEDWETSCSDGKFSVRLRNAKTGRVYYDEFNDQKPKATAPTTAKPE